MKGKLYFLLFLNILMVAAVYVFAYAFSIFAIMSPVFFVFNIAGFAIAYQGVGILTDYLAVAIRNNAEEIEQFLADKHFYVEGGGKIDPFKNLKKYVLLSMFCIVFFGFFGIWLLLFVMESPEFAEAEKRLNLLFIAFSVAGLLFGLSPLKKKIDEFTRKHLSGKARGVDEPIKDGLKKQ
jgi:predicted tellurium resistance membrane protein TerC